MARQRHRSGLPSFREDGTLPPGIHVASWAEIEGRFGTTRHRKRLLSGLKKALLLLKAAGCGRVFIDGSFVTTKAQPNDFDACWIEEGVDPDLLHPALLDFSDLRARQKALFRGELFPASALADLRSPFLQFFQRTRLGGRKGIVALDLKGWEP